MLQLADKKRKEAEEACAESLSGSVLIVSGDENYQCRCPDNSVKLKNYENDQHQCVSCATLLKDFKDVLADDPEYARTLLELSGECSWSDYGAQQLANMEALLEAEEKCKKEVKGGIFVSLGKGKFSCQCPGKSVKLQDNDGQNQCVSCDVLASDFDDALYQGDTEYAQSLVELAGNCSWSSNGIRLLNEKRQQERLDRTCREQIRFSHALITGDRYRCVCNRGQIIATNRDGSACQSCEQIGDHLNKALRNNDIAGAKYLLSIAQTCGWYEEGVRVLANGERNLQQRQNQRPSANSQGIRAQGSYCQKHYLYCKMNWNNGWNNRHGGATEPSSVPMAMDLNGDGICDICNHTISRGDHAERTILDTNRIMCRPNPW